MSDSKFGEVKFKLPLKVFSDIIKQASPGSHQYEIENWIKETIKIFKSQSDEFVEISGTLTKLKEGESNDN